MQRLILVIFFLPMFTLAQQEKGIHFEQKLTWEQVKAKAKNENKYIFVDCYTTWCGPCKMMDINVYPNDTVGRYMKDKFISFRVQMDTGKNDDASTRTLYATARSLEAQYPIEVFPTFLFFSPDGKAVHKGQGLKTVIQFIQVVRDAQDSNKQIYTLIDNWKQGKIGYKDMPLLAKTLTDYKEKSASLAVAKDYMTNFVNKLSDEEFITIDNLKFIGTYIDMVTTKDRMFKAYLDRSETIDSIMGHRGYSNDYAKYIITREDISPVIKESDQSNIEPDWKAIKKRLSNAYGHRVSEYAITSSEVRWYKKRQNWKEYCRSLVREVSMKGGKDMDLTVSTMVYLNNSAWEIFKYSKQKAELEAAVQWSNRAISVDEKYLAGNLDTKACLLYKLGRKKEAIELEQKAFVLSNNATAYKEKIEKMRNGDVTWIE